MLSSYLLCFDLVVWGGL